MNMEIGDEAALFPEKEYISGIFVAVQIQLDGQHLYYRLISILWNSFY
jgi:hypothetical protein